MTRYIIELQAEGETAGIDARELERVAERTLQAEEVAKPAELSVLLADDATVRELNHRYRGTDAATDVLSFSQAEGEGFAQPEGTAPHLGDVVISVDTARRQAAEAGASLQDEVAHLLVHGVLHLLGYDHEEADEAAAMRAREDAVLGQEHRHG
ncbi:MAG TPA: rRNA maturation RNase YbeY [Dehalococcoidia bacterium]|nr:rRNA maturation RNase YbeY [Dehalococcoidia bacterium]